MACEQSLVGSVIALVSITAIACTQEDAMLANPVRILEDEIKAAAACEVSGVESAEVETREFWRGTWDRSVVALEPEEDGVLALSNRGVILKLRYSEAFANARVLGLDVALMNPWMMRRHDGFYFISDAEGVRVINENGTIEQTIVSFYSIMDFVPTRSDRIILNPSFRTGGGPVLVGVDSTGKTQASWGARQDGLRGAVTGITHLAACGGHVVAGFEFAPKVAILNDSFTHVVESNIPYPNRTLMSDLEAREDLVTPSPNVVRMPRYIGGVGCAEEFVFVLLDLPKVCILQMDLDGSIVAVHRGSDAIRGRHYWRLVTTVGAAAEAEVLLYSVARYPDGTRSLVEVKVPLSPGVNGP